MKPQSPTKPDAMKREGHVGASDDLAPDAPSSPAFARRLVEYFRGDGRSTPLLLSLGIALAVVFQVLIQLRINLWQADFFNALERRSAHDIVVQTGLFGVLAAASTAVVVTQLNLTMRLQLGWRRWLSTTIVERWLADARHYQLGFLNRAGFSGGSNL